MLDKLLKGGTAMRLAHCLVGICLAACLTGVGLGQNTNSGDIRGTVTDTSGAVIESVIVTVINNDTGVINKFVTNSEGLYDTNSILPGNYTIEFGKAGFATLKRGSIPLQVGIVTVDATLRVGQTTEVLEVTSTAPLLKTEDAQVNTTLSTAQLTNLPSVDPTNGWTSLMKWLPGATSTPAQGSNGGGGGGDRNPGVDQAIAGTMPYFSSYLVDGGSIWLPHSANIDQGESETVSEVNVITSTASAQYGGGGNVFNLISKSGTNQYHGALYEYFQNDALNARDYFNRLGRKAKQRFNYFGGSIGGPIVKNKLFFYFNYQQLQNPNNSQATVSVPTAAMRAGCFDPAIFGNSLTLDAAHGGAPLTTNAAQCGAFNPADLALPTVDFDPVAVKAQTYWPAPNLSGTNSNYSYLKPANGNSKKTFGRLDYNISDKNRLNITVNMHDGPHKTNADPDGFACPIGCDNNASEGYSAQISDVYSPSSSLVNEFRYSFVRQSNWFVPQSLGKGFPATLGLQFSQADVFPTIQLQGKSAPNQLNTGTNAVFIENTFIPSDVLTLIRGKHILHFGGEVMFEQDNSTPWGSIHGADLTFTGQFTNGGVGYADFLLGDVQQWSTSTQPEHGMRAKNPSFFAQDDLKLRPNVTVNLGVRVEVHGGMSEVKNHMGGFDPTLTNAVTNTLGSIWFAGLNGERTKSFKNKAIAMPRLGLAWQASNNWVVRGGVGQYSSLWSMDTVGGPLGFGTGVTGTASTGSATTPVVQLSGSGAGLPIVSGRNPALYNGQGNGFIPYTPYDLPVMNGWQWTGSVQRRLPGNMVAEGQYVGSRWENLMFEADINQLPANKLGQGQNARPFPQYLGIGIGSGGARTGKYSGVSNYEAVQGLLHKPFSYGLSAELSYTYSRLKDDMDTSGWGNQFGGVFYQDAFNPHANYALSNFDRPHAFKGTVVYAIPLGKGHQYLSSAAADAALGGWQASLSFQAESGAPYTMWLDANPVSGSLCNGCALYPNLVGNPGVSKPSVSQWFNPAAFAIPAQNTFGNNKRNSLRGPKLTDMDFSLGKTWGLPGWEQGKLQLRMDATNILNHPSFQNPDSKLTDSSVGTITGVTIGGRILQLSARFSF
jgi:Carboxypeptidase regulatory-like domain